LHIKCASDLSAFTSICAAVA